MERSDNNNSSYSQSFQNDNLVQNSQADPFARQFAGSVDSYAPFEEKSKSPLPQKIFLVTLITILYAIFVLPSILSTLRYQINTIRYEPCTAEIIDIQEEKYIYEEDNTLKTDYTYYITCSYNYNTKNYTKKFETTAHYNKNEPLEIYVDPESPNTMIRKKSLTGLLAELIANVFFTVVYLIMAVGFWKSDFQKIYNKYSRNQSYTP